MKVLFIFIVSVFICTASTAFAAFSYSVSIDTSSLAGTTGALDFQFNPLSGSHAARASIVDFSSNLFAGDPQTIGNITGELPGTITITASYPINDYFQPFTFGNSLTYTLNLDGTPGTTFGFALFSDSDGSVPALTEDPDGWVFKVRFSTDNASTITTLSPQASVNEVPVPPALWLMGSGLIGLIGVRRRKVL